MLSQDLSRRLIRVGLFVLVAGAFWYVEHYEPTGTRSCVAVYIAGSTVRGYGRSSRERRYYNASSIDDPSAQYHVPYDRTFPMDYVGPAALWIAKGKWTGQLHERLTGRCVDVPDE